MINRGHGGMQYDPGMAVMTANLLTCKIKQFYTAKFLFCKYAVLNGSNGHLVVLLH